MAVPPPSSSSTNAVHLLLDEFQGQNSPLSPASLHSLLQRFLSHPKIHNGFIDILQLPSVQRSLENMDQMKRDSLVNTVKLFAFGTIRDYQELKAKNVDACWTLTNAQLEKLRMLSVVSVARDQIKNCDSSVMKCNSSLSIPYAHLAAELQILPVGSQFNDKDHMRQLEDVLTQCVYSNIIAGKLDQASKAFVVRSNVTLHEQHKEEDTTISSASNTVHGSLLSRDIDTSSATSTSHEVKRMISTLEQFLSSSDKLLSSLGDITNLALSMRKEDEKRWRAVEKKLSEESSRFRDSGGEGIDPMEVVDMSGRRKVKRSRGGHGGR